MKTWIFVVACALVCAASATHAVTLNPKSLGQVLVFPYYTVNNRQDTLLSVVNTSDHGKAAKVRFLEGYNGRSADEPHRLPGGMSAAGKHYFLHGLPAAGFMTYNVTNANAAPGKLANYSGAFTHRQSASCEHDGDVLTGGDPCS